MDGKTLFSGVAQSGVAAIDAGTSCRKAATTFQVSVSTVMEWARRWRCC
jgi:transposase